MATTSQRLKEAMSLRNMRQIDIIEKTGINKGALSSYISGRYIPKQDAIYKMALALDVSEAWLMGRDVPMDRIPLPDGDLTNMDLTILESHIIEAFRNASEDTRVAVCNVLGVKRDISPLKEKSINA